MIVIIVVFNDTAPTEIYTYCHPRSLHAALPIWAWGSGEFRRSSGWALVGRTPDRSERERLLGEPFRMALRPMLFWVAAAGIIGTGISFRRGFGVREIVDIAQILVMGGFATCAISYLVIERTYRPLFACALTGEDRKSTRLNSSH